MTMLSIHGFCCCRDGASSSGDSGDTDNSEDEAPPDPLVAGSAVKKRPKAPDADNPYEGYDMAGLLEAAAKVQLCHHHVCQLSAAPVSVITLLQALSCCLPPVLQHASARIACSCIAAPSCSTLYT